LYSIYHVILCDYERGVKKKMLVIGTVSSPDEEREVRSIAEVFLIGERIRHIARQQKNK
jgi:hypothetical protein